MGRDFTNNNLQSCEGINFIDIANLTQTNPRNTLPHKIHIVEF